MPERDGVCSDRTGHPGGPLSASFITVGAG